MRRFYAQQLQSNGNAVDRLMPLISEFHSASLELLAQRKLTARTDWKFMLSFERLPQILFGMSQSHALLYAGSSRVGRYRSRYYDTPVMRCYQDHRRRVPRRFKLRHRHYLDRSLTMFEVKVKNPRGDTRKKRVKVPFLEHGGSLDPMCLEFASDFLGISMDDFAPSLDNSFNRITLLAYEAEERITIDFDMAFSQNGYSVKLPGLIIIEVKSTSPRHLTPTLQRLSDAGLRPQGMSKYCAGITLLDSELVPSCFAGLRRRISSMSEPSFTPGIIQ